MIASENVPALAPGEFYMVNDNINVDLSAFDLAPGTYYVGLIVDHTNAVVESDENNNNDCHWNEPRVYVAADINQPNLTCDFRGELIVNNNAQTLYTSWNAIQNNGNATAPASVVGVYLSPDQDFTTSDLFLAEVNIPAIAAGQTYVVTDPINVNFGQYNLAPGTYYVGLVVDHTNVVTESDETDNATCSWNEPRVYIGQDLPDDQPNLLCKSRGELEVNGTNITIEFAKVQNNGTLVSQPANVGFYVSADQNFTTSDYFIGSARVGQLFPSQFEMLDPFTVNLADFNIPAGNYFIGFVIDYDNQIDELEENDNNNCGWATLATIPNSQADLTCMSRGELIVDNAAQTLYVSWTKVQNIGSATAAASTVGFYISEDTNITTSDILFATANIGALAPNDFEMISSDINFDFSTLGLAPGTYHVGIIVDYDNEVAEANENNNNTCHWDEPRIYIAAPQNDADLTCYDRGYLSVTGTSVSIHNLKIANVGSATAAASTVGIYLSTDQNFTTTDYFIGNVNLPALGVNQIHALSFNADVAALNLPSGNYYVGVIVDESNLVIESEEGNNATCSWNNPQVHISNDLPNLECDFGGEVVVTPGPHIRVTWIKVRNSGTATAAASSVGFYLSTDQNFTPSDHFIGSVAVPSLAPGEVIMVPPFDVDVTGVPSGTYYIGFIIDHEFLVVESNENDNNACSFEDTVVIYGGLPDLICVDAGTLHLSDGGQGVVESNDLVVDVRDIIVGNAGQTNTTACSVGFFLSDDGIYGNAGDVLIGETNIGSIAAGQNLTIPSFVGAIPENLIDNLAQGEYTIGVKLDYKFEVAESNEQNNDDCGYGEIIVVDPMPVGADLVCKDNGEITIDGTNFTVSWSKLQNIGDLPSGATTVTFYASTDTNFTPNDYAVGTINIPAIQPGQVIMLPNFTRDLANAGLPAGNYHIGFIVNAWGSFVVEQEGTLGCFWDSTVHIPAAQPNLTCMNRGEIEANGSILDITWVKIQNNGGGVAGGSQLG
ncbi:MAG: CARDB domain-containing protein, partial [Bacteroidota bacterium]